MVEDIIGTFLSEYSWECMRDISKVKRSEVRLSTLGQSSLLVVRRNLSASLRVGSLSIRPRRALTIFDTSAFLSKLRCTPALLVLTSLTIYRSHHGLTGRVAAWADSARLICMLPRIWEKSALQASCLPNVFLEMTFAMSQLNTEMVRVISKMLYSPQG